MDDRDFALNAIRDGARPPRISAADALNRAEGSERRLNLLIVVSVVLAVLAASGHARAVMLGEALQDRTSFQRATRAARGPAMPWDRLEAVTMLRRDILSALDALAIAAQSGDPELAHAAQESLDRIRSK